MWIRTETGKLLNCDHVEWFQYGGYRSDQGDLQAVMHDGHEITVKKVASASDAESALNRIHEWLDLADVHPAGQVLDLRKEQKDV